MREVVGHIGGEVELWHLVVRNSAHNPIGPTLRTANFVYVEDIVIALIAGARSSKRRQQVLDQGVRDSIALKTLAQSIVRKVGSSSTTGVKPLAAGEFRYHCPDTSLAKIETGFVAKRDVMRCIPELLGSVG